MAMRPVLRAKPEKGEPIPAIELRQNGLVSTSLKLIGHGKTGAAQWIVGRSLESDLTINHPTISRKHARVHKILQVAPPAGRK